MTKKYFMTAVFIVAAALCVPIAFAGANSYCEAVKVTGDAKLIRFGTPAVALEQGMSVHKGDRIVVGAASSVDLAFDPEWKNVSHLGENTRAIVRYLDPVRVEISSGDIYSKLDLLKKGTKFEVVTPVAIASVRGTKFRVTHSNGSTTIYNDSETSEVYVYHVDENGNRAGRVIILKPGQSVMIEGEARVFDSYEELQDARDKEDENQLNEDLNSRPKNSGFTPEPPAGGGGEYL